MRLANLEKASYFPLPPSVTDLILTHIAAPQGGRILDPCAGKGAALVTFAEKLGLDPFGIELHEGRAEAAREVVNQLVASQAMADEHTTRILHDSYLNLITSRGGYNLLFTNPPYQHDDEDGRLEYQWLVHTRPWLQPGGLLVWVVPQHMLRFRKATRYILSWYDQVQIYRFPDDTYDQFKQMVLFGIHRLKAVTPDGEMVEKLAQLALDKEMLPQISAVVTSESGTSRSTLPLRRPAVLTDEQDASNQEPQLADKPPRTSKLTGFLKLTVAAVFFLLVGLAAVYLFRFPETIEQLPSIIRCYN